MDQIKQLLLSLSLKQRISLGAAAWAVVAGIFAFAHWNRERDFKPLYSGLSQEDAAAVVAKIKESGTEFRLADGGSAVLVSSAKVSELRLQLAAAGIPKSGRIGFELFDKTNFGASDFTEQINYHRALEGELERTIMALAEVEQARIHITFPKDSVFTESKQSAKASILLKLRPGARLSPQNVAAICQLAASAVEGLNPDAISLVDMRGNLLNRPKRAAAADQAEPDDALLEYKGKIERDLLSKINTTLEPLLGADKFRAGVSVECDFSSGEQSEETFDPSKSVMVTSQKTEDVSSSGGPSGVPGTASNLPRPSSRPGSGGNGVARRTENITYQSSRTVRKVRLPQGAVRRMSVSVLLDHRVRYEGSGPRARRIVEPPSAEKVKALRELVAGVIGFSQQRGDQLIVESLPFESTLNPEPAPVNPAPATPTGLPAWLENALKQKTLWLAGACVGALLTVALAALLLQRRNRKRKKAAIQDQLAAGQAGEELGKVDDAQKRIESQLADQARMRERQEFEALTALKLPPIQTKKTEILAKHINEEARKDPKVMAQIVSAWLNEGTK